MFFIRTRAAVAQTRSVTVTHLLLVSVVFTFWDVSSGCAQQTDTSADVVVYGGSSAGIAAAIQVSRMGHSVVMIEPSGHTGGLTSGGLGFTDSGDKRVIGGISREFYQRIRQHYDKPEAWTLSLIHI